MTQTFAETVRQWNSESIRTEFPEVASVSPSQQSTPTLTGPKDDDVFEGADLEQIKLMDETCIVVDYEDRPIGQASKRTCHLMSNINRGLLHRAFSLFLFNNEGKLLLQQRANEKITFPGMWTNTCCSHPLSIPSEIGHDLATSIDGVKSAAQRKLQQELGIASDFLPLHIIQFLTRIHYVAPCHGLWGEHEIDYILIARTNPIISPNPNEVKDVKYVSAPELKNMFKDKCEFSSLSSALLSSPQLSALTALTFTPWFKLICESYLFQWWDQLDSLHQFQESLVRRML